MRRMVSFLLVGSLLCAAACSSDEDDDGDEAPWSGVEWRCFEGPDDCWCANEASSPNPRVDACSYTNCMAYEYYGWHCECRPEIFEPEPNWETVADVLACPPPE